jgi:hypothetical protein
MPLKTFLFPTIGNNKPKNLSDVVNIAAELNTVLGKFCKDQGIDDPQGIKLPGLNDALKLVKSYKDEVAGTKNELAVRGGINDKGHLALTLSGILPRKGKPVKIQDEVIIRKDFESLIEEMRNEKHVVVNLQAGDPTIDRAAANQAKKFDTTVDEPDDADFGEITTGNVILAAHGQRTEVNGTIIGVSLGKRTAEEIVALLTTGDKKKRLNTDFSGTVWLSGCFTASGGIAPPGEDYDYESFARSVWELLKSKGYKKATVKGQPGIARTDSQGDKSSVTPTGQKDYDRLKKELAALQKNIDGATTALDVLAKRHQTAGTSLASDPKVAQLSKMIVAMEGEAKRIGAEKESHVIEKLVATYGLKVR